ncbi:MAG: hypothetical protein VZR37_06850, partial [Bifidobacterium merycicum]|nr:hypothetical protein [Bifidobacterium merycicum]
MKQLLNVSNRRSTGIWAALIFLVALNLRPAIAAGDIIRSFAGETGVWAGTVIFASAIAVGNVLVPVVAKRDYPNHVAMATGAYSACITCGSALAGLTASAMAEVWGGWRHALAFWAVPPLLVALLWSCRIVHSWRAMAFGRTPEEPFAVP